MEQIILPHVTTEQQSADTTLFRITPLFPGYGHTLGNALRRVLLSSLPGSAVSSVTIEGANHEFSSIPGVKEDAVEIILNLKNLSVEMLDTAEPVTLTLSSKGPGTVTAKDFKPNSKVRIANPNLHIATLSAKSTLNLDVIVEYGRGYDPVEKREAKSLSLGTIAIDSLFTPVRSVSIEVENTRVGKMTNYDELHLTIQTDGTITPDDAFKAASAILVDQFGLLAHFDDVPVQTSTDAETAADPINNEVTELVSAGIPARVAKILGENGFGSLTALKAASDDDLKAVSGLGPKALTEINKIRE